MSKTAVITGGSRGIGSAIAKRLAKDGYNIALCVRNEDTFLNKGGKETLEACEEFGVQASYFTADVSVYSECESMIKQIRATFESIDVLINNAGITKDTLLPRMSEQQFDDVISANLKSTFNMMKPISAIMIKQRSGRIINISSVVGLYGGAGQVNYAASKAGMIGMTLSAAKELGGRGITVNAVAPGYIQTPMTDVLSDDLKALVLSAITLKRYGNPEEIAGTVSFLASQDASYITGQVIVVDGGMML
ncbi:MAG: 3-oxoacyl-[acyl-carrier-protein] reductase [Oscillospiraceae bacterium]